MTAMTTKSATGLPTAEESAERDRETANNPQRAFDLIQELRRVLIGHARTIDDQAATVARARDEHVELMRLRAETAPAHDLGLSVAQFGDHCATEALVQVENQVRGTTPRWLDPDYVDGAHWVADLIHEVQNVPRARRVVLLERAAR